MLYANHNKMIVRSWYMQMRNGKNLPKRNSGIMLYSFILTPTFTNQ